MPVSLCLASRGGEREFPPRPCGLAVVDWPRAPQAHDLQTALHCRRERAKPIGSAAMKPDRRLGVGVAVAPIAGLEGFYSRLSEHHDGASDLRIEGRIEFGH